MHPLPSVPLPWEGAEHPGAPGPGVGGRLPGRPLPDGYGEPGRACRCGHGRTAHLHYRQGTDCSLCDCGRFRRPRRLRWQLLCRRSRR